MLLELLLKEWWMFLSMNKECFLFLTLKGSFSVPQGLGEGGMDSTLPPPFDSSENWYVEYSICTYATIKFVRKIFQF